jgi:hypothetical protein
MTVTGLRSGLNYRTGHADDNSILLRHVSDFDGPCGVPACAARRCRERKWYMSLKRFKSIGS